MPTIRKHVRGEVRFGADAESFSGATAYVRLEDVTRQDAAARIVAEQVIRHLSYDPRRPQPFAFDLAATIRDAKSSYAVSVHVDVDHDGQVSTGDYISTESYPVLTLGNPDQVSVRVEKVT